MSGDSSVFQTSGGGYDFEHYVQAAFLTSMIIQGSIPVFPRGKIEEIDFQCKNKGYQTDDLFLKISDRVKHRILVQIKYNISISEKNETFFEVLNSFWNDFNNNTIFNKENDKFFLIKSSLTNDDKNHIVVLSEWASTHSNEEDFYSEVNRINVKREKLQIFENLLQRANGDKKPTNKSIWEFLRCFHLLAYDFSISSSTNKSQILNLIKLSKSKSESTEPLDIWNTIVEKCSEYNRNGGNITLERIADINLHRFFDLSIINNIYSSLKKLLNDSSLVIKPFKSTVDGYHINRIELKSRILESIGNSKITFITGSPGVGKSAILKEILINELKHTSPLIFKADQFNKSTIAHVFSEIGIQHSIVDIFNVIALLQNKVIVIDSAEKLLEGEADNAYKQLLEIIDEVEDLHLILTSRSYAVSVISQKFGIKKDMVDMIEVPQLTDEELINVQENFPVLESLLLNQEIKKVLRSPKYLELALNSIKKESFKSSEINISDFKNKLWNQIIENSTVVRNGLARRRKKTFLHIAVGRASTMHLFFNPDDREIDYEALDELINDDVLIKNKTNDAFSPSHDILEDWALIKHIDSMQKVFTNKIELFQKLGNQPALRRAFRLWVEELILSDMALVVNLVKETRYSSNVEGYWGDEILTAIFRSAKCNAFFEVFKNDLLEGNATFLNRCILLIRTTCKEYSFSNKTTKDILFPVGSGWQEVLFFIANNIDALDIIRNSILKLLLDWEFKYLFISKKCDKEEIESSCKILLYYIKQMEKNDDFWKGHEISNQKEQLLYMLFGLSQFASKEIKQLLERCDERTNEYGRLYDFDETVIKKALGGIRNQNLVRELPDVLIRLANKHWKHTPIKKTQHIGPFGFEIPSVIDRDESWGITTYRFDFFPSGIYKTFVYNLLLNHPAKAIKFIVDFTNYITLSYKDSEYGKKEELKTIQLQLNNGDTVLQYGNHFLWCAYRGTTVTHYLLESILVSFEKYLLDLIEFKVEENKLLKSIVTYSLNNSNSVVLSSVLVSVFISNPKPFEDTILPILRTKEFYEFDLNRATSEHNSLEIADSQIPNAQEEKWKSNQLPHRRKYLRGLRDFITDYQFNVGNLNNQIQGIFDGFYKNCGDDIFWKKAINEMDIRKYKPTAIDKEKGTIQLEVIYPKEVQKAVEDFSKKRKDEDLALSHSAIISKAKEGKEPMIFENWVSAYSHFSSNETRVSMFDMPVTLSVIGINQFQDMTSTSQKKWCLEIIFETLQKIIGYLFYRSWSMNGDIGFNILEKEITTESIHLLYEHIHTSEDLLEINVALAYLLICPMADHERRKFYKYFRNIFSPKFPEISKKMIALLIEYSSFIKKNERPYFQEKLDLEKFEKKEFTFIKKSIRSKQTIKYENLDFVNNESSFLLKALCIIPVDTDDNIEQDFIIKMIDLIFQDLTLEYGDSFRRTKKDRKINHVALLDLRFYFNQVLLYNSIDFSKKLVDSLISPLFEDNNINEDIYELTTGIFDVTVTILDDIIVENDPVKLKKYSKQFWEIWKYLYGKVISHNEDFFIKQLLLDVNDRGWSIKSNNWAGLVDENIFYEKMIEGFGESSLPHIINVFSSFGEKVFLPNGIHWIVKFIVTNPGNIKYLNSNSAVKLIQVLFSNHITEIKNNQILIAQFIYILNLMVDLGYSEAYLIRECVIVYKKTA